MFLSLFFVPLPPLFLVISSPHELTTHTHKTKNNTFDSPTQRPSHLQKKKKKKLGVHWTKKKKKKGSKNVHGRKYKKNVPIKNGSFSSLLFQPLLRIEAICVCFGW